MVQLKGIVGGFAVGTALLSYLVLGMPGEALAQSRIDTSFLMERYREFSAPKKSEKKTYMFLNLGVNADYTLNKGKITETDEAIRNVPMRPEDVGKVDSANIAPVENAPIKIPALRANMCASLGAGWKLNKFNLELEARVMMLFASQSYTETRNYTSDPGSKTGGKDDILTWYGVRPSIHNIDLAYRLSVIILGDPERTSRKLPGHLFMQLGVEVSNLRMENGYVIYDGYATVGKFNLATMANCFVKGGFNYYSFPVYIKAYVGAGVPWILSRTGFGKNSMINVGPNIFGGVEISVTISPKSVEEISKIREENFERRLKETMRHRIH